MYAVFKLSGIQFSAEEGEIIKAPLQNAKQGAKIDITDILLVKDKGRTLIGTPYVANAKIQAEVIEHGKSDKVLVYKYKRRTKYRRTQGHRQKYSEVKINKIVAPKTKN
ncbi:MAG: 50S ribosomal protein L21 [Candidatus Zixiibacteriota bacterium]|nr:MAG: 50S ribosomal protein L21 [candidate division Zixibacteria bacterium]